MQKCRSEIASAFLFLTKLSSLLSVNKDMAFIKPAFVVHSMYIEKENVL